MATRKLRADGEGHEVEQPLSDWLDIGVFGEVRPGESGDRPLYLEKHLITEPTTTIDVVVDEPPIKAGIDPYHKLIDRRPRDNTRNAPEPEGA